MTKRSARRPLFLRFFDSVGRAAALVEPLLRTDHETPKPKRRPSPTVGRRQELRSEIAKLEAELARHHARITSGVRSEAVGSPEGWIQRARELRAKLHELRLELVRVERRIEREKRLWPADRENATREQLAELSLFETRVWPVSWIMIAICGLHSVLMSHRVFGPLRNVRNATLDIGTGKLSRRLKFRKHDLMDGLRDDLNDMMDKLDGMMGQAKESQARCRGHLSELAECIPEGVAPPAPLTELTREFEALDKICEGYTTEEEEIGRFEPVGASDA